MKPSIDNFPVTELKTRFNIGKQTVYNRLDLLNIKPFKEKNRSYIKGEQLELLDLLHEHISKGGKMADFKVQHDLSLQSGNNSVISSPVDTVASLVDNTKTHSPVRIETNDISGGQETFKNRPVDTMDTLRKSPMDTMDIGANSNYSNDFQLLVQLISSSVEKAITSSSPSKSPLWYMDELRKASEEGWLLTTSEIQELIGVKPRTKKGENTYIRGSFSFIKSGKIGNQTAWKVQSSTRKP